MIRMSDFPEKDISFSEMGKPKYITIGFSRCRSHILEIKSEGLSRSHTICPQECIDYDPNTEHLVKIIGIDII